MDTILKAMLFVACALTCIVFSKAAAAQASADGRPNIVIIIADDLTWRDIGVYGNGEIRTPHIDRLARDGVRFTHAFQAAPMCSPTRSNLYTGLYPVRSGAYPNHAFVDIGVRSIFQYLQDVGYRVGLSGKEHVAPSEAFPYQHLSEGRDPDFAQIRTFIELDAQQPFFLVVASNQPHTPWDRRGAETFDPATLTLPPKFIDTPETRDALARYYSEVSYLDGEVAQMLELLERTGVAGETLVIFTSEQGAAFPGAKWTLYDRGIRTALIARWPGRIEAGTTTDAMVEYTDVVPTLLELVGGESVAGLDGRSFAEVLLGTADSHKDHVFGIQTSRGIYHGPESFGIRSVRSRRYKYIRNLSPDTTFTNALTNGAGDSAFWKSWLEQARIDPEDAQKVRQYQHRPPEELYDLAADPEELLNLAGDPDLAEVKAELRTRLAAWMEDQGDRGLDTELKAHQHQTKWLREHGR